VSKKINEGIAPKIFKKTEDLKRRSKKKILKEDLKRRSKK
jgi:hypothetical protein